MFPRLLVLAFDLLAGACLDDRKRGSDAVLVELKHGDLGFVVDTLVSIVRPMVAVEAGEGRPSHESDTQPRLVFVPRIDHSSAVVNLPKHLVDGEKIGRTKCLRTAAC